MKVEKLTLTLPQERLALVALIREESGVGPDQGPTDSEISEALEGFAGQFDYWFDRVIANAVPQYRKLLIARINPFIRGIEYQGFDAPRVARELVHDYVNRNFVTAGGWAIERMAIALGSKNSKAAAAGIDLHRIDPNTGAHHLYVIKSGTVTRNSDILSALKRHAEAARKLLIQGGSKVSVFAHYAIAAGATRSTYHDNIYRPSSADFWADVTGLNADRAMRLAYSISRRASDIIKRESARHIEALELLVMKYIGRRDNVDLVDWDFLFDRTMKERTRWVAEDVSRHAMAWQRLLDSGYNPDAEALAKAIDEASEGPATE